MSRQAHRIALTKRALAKQLMRAGCPKREAEAAVARLTYREMVRKLPLHVRAEIAWKTTIAPGSTR